MKSIFSQNLIKARKLRGWSQNKTASLLGITRAAYSSYELNRAQPSHELLTDITELFGVEDDMHGFLNNIDFYENTGKRRKNKILSALEKKYYSLQETQRTEIDRILGLKTA